jgi:hypothetical protein
MGVSNSSVQGGRGLVSKPDGRQPFSNRHGASPGDGTQFLLSPRIWDAVDYSLLVCLCEFCGSVPLCLRHYIAII